MTKSDLPTPRPRFETATSQDGYPFVISKAWPSVHSIFRQDAQVGTCLYNRKGRGKYEIVVRNYFGTETSSERRFAYLDDADQEIKIEWYDQRPWKIRLSNNFQRDFTEREFRTWDSDQPWEHISAWKTGHEVYEPFPLQLTSTDIFTRFENFAQEAVKLMSQNTMTDFSVLNEITGMNFEPTPSFPSGPVLSFPQP